MVTLVTDMNRLADRLQALSDNTRLHIVGMLGSGECCQCDIKDELGTAQPLLSFHLKVLREAGLIRSRRRGRWVFYSLCREAIAEIETFLEQLNAAGAASTCCGGPEQAESREPN